MNLILYAGTFDPPTLGHLWMIHRGMEIAEKLVVAVGQNPDKKPMFSIEERIAMLVACVQETHSRNVGKWDDDLLRYRIRFDTCGSKLLIHYAQEVGAKYILRGIRNAHDAEYERNMRCVNADIDPSIQTIFLMPPRDLCEVSSSLVKGLMKSEGWQNIVSRYVPSAVMRRLVARQIDRAKDRLKINELQKGDRVLLEPSMFCHDGSALKEVRK